MWMTVALGGYFFAAVVALLDKYILSGPIKAPATYAFYVSLFSLFALFFIPFGFQFVGWQTIGVFLVSGVMFQYGLVAFYTAVSGREISRIAPLVGTVISLVAFSAILLPGGFAESAFSLVHVFALALLMSGGLLLAFDLPLRPSETLPPAIFVAGLAIGFSLLALKYGYGQANFVSGLVWSRVGMFLGGMTLLFVPMFRQQILASTRYPSDPAQRVAQTGALFVVNKISAGVSAFLITYALSIGPVSFVQALSGIQYVFLLLLAWPLAYRYPAIFGERLTMWDWIQKAVAIALIALGLWLAATASVKFLL